MNIESIVPLSALGVLVAIYVWHEFKNTRDYRAWLAEKKATQAKQLRVKIAGMVERMTGRQITCSEVEELVQTVISEHE